VGVIVDGDGDELTAARRTDGVEDEDGEEVSATGGESDMPARKGNVNRKSTSFWCHHSPITLP
jgi:hypothetical protein